MKSSAALRERAARLVQGYGLIESGLDRCVQVLGDKAITRGTSALVERERVSDPVRALDFFSVYTFPATRHILFCAGEGWTAAVNNSKNGSDFADYAHGWSHALHSRTLRVVDEPSVVWKKDGQREVMGYEARIVTILDERSAETRSITCMNDGGRWVFHASGDPLRVESSFNSSAKRVKDRFTRDNLRALLASMPAPVVDEEAFFSGASFSLVEETYRSSEWQARIQSAVCTEQEMLDPAHGYFQRGLGWMEHLSTHSSSAIADFERALALNPDYEPRVRPHLDQAYQSARRT